MYLKAFHFILEIFCIGYGLPRCISDEEPTCKSRRHERQVLIPELGRSPRGGHGNLLQYSYLENPMDRAAWRATVHSFAESSTSEYLRKHTYTQEMKLVPNSCFSVFYYCWTYLTFFSLHQIPQRKLSYIFKFKLCGSHIISDASLINSLLSYQNLV